MNIETVPGAFDLDPGEIPGNPWMVFQVSGQPARVRLLQQLSEAAAPLSLGRAGGTVVAATLWSVDAARGRLHFNAGPEVARLLKEPDALLFGAAYLGSHKLQFPLRKLTLASAVGNQVQLQADLPALLLRLPRRQELRLRRPAGEALSVRFAHPLASDTLATLAVLDVSVGGCALLRLPRTLPLVPGMALRAVEWLEGEETLFYADLEVVHSGRDASHPEGLRLGCRWGAMAPATRVLLTQWLERGQRRRSRFTFELDWADMTLPLPTRS